MGCGSGRTSSGGKAVHESDAIWVHDALYNTIGTDTSFKSPPPGSTDVIFSFANSGLAGQRSVAVYAPGDPQYNGGRWHVSEHRQHHDLAVPPNGLTVHDSNTEMKFAVRRVFRRKLGGDFDPELARPRGCGIPRRPVLIGQVGSGGGHRPPGCRKKQNVVRSESCAHLSQAAILSPDQISGTGWRSRASAA